MTNNLEARWRLMRGRFRNRLKRAVILALVTASFLAFTHGLREIWWRFPAYAVTLFVFWMVWPWRIEGSDNV